MTSYAAPTFTFVGTGSPTLDGFVGVFGGVGPNNIGYVFGGGLVDAGAFTQLTGAAIGAFAEPYAGPGLAKNVSGAFTPTVKALTLVGNGISAAYDGLGGL